MDNVFRVISRYGTYLGIVLFTLFLTSCSHVSRPDGPPNFYVDETKIPNPTPKPEPLAKYGNMPVYRVFGKSYYTMRSSKNYQATGTASWYGTKFHAQRTSSGEPYDMLGMTAAHKTLPLPTYVQVTNLKNHRQIIVKVNDRGPFEGNRLIDLSYVAAKKLGMIGHGTTMVAVKAIDPYTYNHSTAFANHTISKTNASRTQGFQLASAEPGWQASESKQMYLQVGAFQNKYRAEQLREHLLTYLDAPIKISNPSFGGKLYRVQVGPIKDVATANALTQKLKELGITPNKIHL